MRFGIGITTRNRPHALAAALAHLKEYPTPDARYVVVNDNGDEDGSQDLVTDAHLSGEVSYVRSPRRVGISGSKNACLVTLQDCDHVFLFDDDCWPVSNDWAERWTYINEVNGVGHSMFNIVDGLVLDRNTVFKQLMEVTGEIGEGDTRMISFSNCFGPLLYFSRSCLTALGGFDPDTPNVWGYEHAQMSQRAGRAGFTQGHRYLTPWVSQEMIYSVDLSYSMLRLLPPLEVLNLDSFVSSTTAEEKDNSTANSVILSREPIHIPLEAPEWLS